MKAVDRVIASPAGEQLLVGDQMVFGLVKRSLPDRPSASGQP